MYGAERFKPLKTQIKCNTNKTSRHQLRYTTDKRKFTIYLYSPTRKLEYNLKLHFSHISHFPISHFMLRYV